VELSNLIWVVIGVAAGILAGWYTWGRTRAGMSQQVVEMRTRLTSMELDRQRLNRELDAAREKAAQLTVDLRRSDERDTSHDMMVVLREIEADVELQQIRGVGPKLALALAGEGITTLARLANLTDSAVEHLAIRLPAVADRIIREGWREQARELLENRRVHPQQLADHAGGRAPEDVTVERVEPDQALTP
jgi:predicted flap endonuclease-1-like 5' DNA nuclease